MAKKPKQWAMFDRSGDFRVVKAYTKSEARAAFKRELGYKKRLPPGTVVAQVATK